MAVPSSSQYDVFLCHSRIDKPEVEELARRLKQEGIEPFLDKWNLIPGQPWQEALEKALRQSAACAVIIGSGPFGPWQSEEMRVALAFRVCDCRGKFPVIPVLLPGAERPRGRDLPAFLRRMTWVEFPKSLNDEQAFHRLVCGIRGIAPGPGLASAILKDVDFFILATLRDDAMEWARKGFPKWNSPNSPGYYDSSDFLLYKGDRLAAACAWASQHDDVVRSCEHVSEFLAAGKEYKYEYEKEDQEITDTLAHLH